MNQLKKVFASLVVLLASTPAFAAGAAFSLEGDGMFLGLLGLGAGLGVGLAAFGAASGQGKAAAAALEGIARNPGSSGKMFVPLVLSLALMESLVILSFLVTSGLGTAISKALGL
jgi:F-type H+-transporting ATPase subunit c